MTLMLASVINRAEAEAALTSGVDIIDLKDPAKGALGPLDLGAAAEIVAAVGKRKQISAAAGDHFETPGEAVKAALDLAATGVDYVKVGLSSDAAGADRIRALGALAGKVKLVGVLFADRQPDLDLLDLMAAQGFVGAMLDTAAKGKGRLLNYMDVAALAPFVDRCRGAGLMSGLAGSLEAPDVPRLLPLRPDYLGFRGSLCKSGDREASIDPAAVAMIRDLIPHVADSQTSGGETDVDWRLLGRGYVPVNEITETDRIFVHDLVMPCYIGAYEFERAKKQDVRFNIDVDVARARMHSDDMRDIFSYDLIVDAIKIITGRGHIELIETLVREIADSVLSHPSVVSVVARVEKLDVIRGAVGVEIKRERAKEAAALNRRFASVDIAAPKLRGSRSH
ncbi:Dihydroneopterin aldolase [Methylocella tundrae]|jgi:dihydroneopterin aldolase|uniref:4-(hydroxymethyl)-2-furancarboxaldehyde-phosphate synthase n=2 Tax=Methylocella tundrae TaxID=227605 RepID=A0A4U8Z2Q3_METTU|nr:(5-formylfuran-3-yl)methyl phosphate synthase [Methylocella tundrae]VFU09619.1 Dihydroneopterin aldolase [Methylocella tundrae]